MKTPPPGPADDAECLRYSDSGGYEFAEVQLDRDTDALRVAMLILENLPALHATDSDARYVPWYESRLDRVRTVDDLPVAYADYSDQTEGWELGWGSGRCVPAPPSLN